MYSLIYVDDNLSKPPIISIITPSKLFKFYYYLKLLIYSKDDLVSYVAINTSY